MQRMRISHASRQMLRRLYIEWFITTCQKWTPLVSFCTTFGTYLNDKIQCKLPVMQQMRIGHASRWMFEKVASSQRWQHWGCWGSSGTMCQMIAEVEVGGSPGQRPHRRPREQQHHDSENVREQKYVGNFEHTELGY